MFKVQLKMAFAVIFHFVVSYFRCQKRSAIQVLIIILCLIEVDLIVMKLQHLTESIK